MNTFLLKKLSTNIYLIYNTQYNSFKHRCLLNNTFCIVIYFIYNNTDKLNLVNNIDATPKLLIIKSGNQVIKINYLNR